MLATTPEARATPAKNSKPSAQVNQKIQNQIRERLRILAENPSLIPNRLRELDQEWDIERAIEANASLLALGGIALGVSSDRRWFALPALVTAFLFNMLFRGGAHLFPFCGG